MTLQRNVMMGFPLCGVFLVLPTLLPSYVSEGAYENDNIHLFRCYFLFGTYFSMGAVELLCNNFDYERPLLWGLLGHVP